MAETLIKSEKTMTTEMLNSIIKTRRNDYREKLENLEYIAKKINDIGDPLRLAIIDHLKHHKKLSLSQMVILLETDASEMEYHLTKLKEKNLIIKTIIGDTDYYMLRDKHFAKIINYLKKSSYFFS